MAERVVGVQMEGVQAPREPIQPPRDAGGYTAHGFMGRTTTAVPLATISLVFCMSSLESKRIARMALAPIWTACSSNRFMASLRLSLASSVSIVISPPKNV